MLRQTSNGPDFFRMVETLPKSCLKFPATSPATSLPDTHTHTQANISWKNMCIAHVKIG